MVKLKKIYRKLVSERWELGIVNNTLKGIVEGEPLEVKWIINKDKSHWYADPFILDVTDECYIILAEDMPIGGSKAVLSKLTVDKKSMYIVDSTVILDLPTHLSFPAILRENNKTYVYPENCYANVLNIYELVNNKLINPHNLSSDTIWDSIITDFFGERFLFTARSNDFFLDVYKWDIKNEKFVYWKSIPSDVKNSRMAGQLFEVDGHIYCPCQDCSQTYGGAVIIKEVSFNGTDFTFTPVRRLVSPHLVHNLGLHTFNNYNGAIVIDVKGFNYPVFGKSLSYIAAFFRKCKII